MWCGRCGAKLSDGSKFCPACGCAAGAAPGAPLSAPAPRPIAAEAPGGFMRPGGLTSGPDDLSGGTMTGGRSIPEPVIPPMPADPPYTPPVHVAPPVYTPPVAPPTPPVSTAPPVSPAPAPPVRSAPTPERVPAAGRRISAGRELKLLLHQGWLVLLGERRNLIISLLFPFIAAAIIIWIAGKDMFINHESTKSACFIIVCSAIWCGLFNSIQSIVKERENIKRDYVSGALRIECYTASRAILQLCLCLVQSIVLFLAIPGVALVYDNDLPNSGILFDSPLPEYFISIFFVLLASDTMGLAISSFVKKDELASKLAPYILIAELLFSGTLFEMKGIAKVFSGIMISRWGMEALGSISDVNAIEPRANIESGMPLLPLYEFEEFDPTGGHLLGAWAIMLMFVLVPLVICNVCLHNVKKDTRS